jgi:hypothetical protein
MLVSVVLVVSVAVVVLVLVDVVVVVVVVVTSHLQNSIIGFPLTSISLQPKYVSLL